MPNNCPPHPRSAFTLIELLSAIAVLAILGAILIPAIGNVRQSAKETQGLSNLRQIGLAAVLYGNEHNGKLPSQREARANGENHWSMIMEAYTGTSEGQRSAIFVDPSSSVSPEYNAPQFILNPFVAPPAGFSQRTYLLHQVPARSNVIYAADGILDSHAGWAQQDMWNLGGQGQIWSSPVSMWAAAYGGNPKEPIAYQDIVAKPGGDGDIAYRAKGNSAAKVVFLDGSAAFMEKGSILARHIQPAYE